MTTYFRIPMTTDDVTIGVAYWRCDATEAEALVAIDGDACPGDHESLPGARELGFDLWADAEAGVIPEARIPAMLFVTPVAWRDL